MGIKKKFETEGDLVLIKWEDHWSNGQSGWKSKSDLKDHSPMIISSVGWIIHETREGITMAAHMSDDLVDGDLTIIKKDIKERVKLG